MLKFRFLRVKILISHHSPWSNPIFHAISRLRDFVLQLQRVEHPGAARWRGGSSIEKPGDSHRKAYEISFVMIILRYIIRYIYICIYIYISYIYITHIIVIYIYIHTYVRTYVHTYIHTYIHTYTHTFMYRHVYVWPTLGMGASQR